MKEKIKKILLWLVLLYLIYAFVATLLNIINIASPSYRSSLETTLESEGSVDIVFLPHVDITLNLIFLLLFGGIIVVVYKKLFSKKESKEETRALKESEDTDKEFGGSFLSKALFISHFFVLIFAISGFILGNWQLGILGVVIAVLMVFISYRLAGGKRNPIIWKDKEK